MRNAGKILLFALILLFMVCGISLADPMLDAGSARSYTKLGQNGTPLPDTATQASGWDMTRDNVTGLMWEIKTDDETIHDRLKTCFWHESNPETNDGNVGARVDGNGTEAFINTLNAQHFGGYSDWRMPTVKELDLLAIRGMYRGSDTSMHGPAIDTTWFPCTLPSCYWSSTTWADYTGYAWYVNFYRGGSDSDPKSSYKSVRAVRAGQ